MKLGLLFLLLYVSLTAVRAQDTTLELGTSMFSPNHQITLSAQSGWVYHSGHNPAWAGQAVDTTAWVRRQPGDLSVDDADRNGRVEGWFRLNIRLDSTFNQMSVGLQNGTWAATEVYVNGQLIASFGRTGSEGVPYTENSFPYQPPIDVPIDAGKEYLIALHVVDYTCLGPYFFQKKLKSQVEGSLANCLQLTGSAYTNALLKKTSKYVAYITLWSSVSVFITLFFWLLSGQNLYEKKTIRLLAILWTFGAISNLCRFTAISDPSFAMYYGSRFVMHFCLWQTLFFAIMVSLNLFGYRIKYQWLSIGIVIAFAATVIGDQVGGDTVISIANILQQLFYVSLIIYYWKRLKGAQWAIVTGLISSNVFSILYAISVFRKTDFDFYLNFTGIALSLPVSFLVYIALRFKETLTEVQQQATAVLQVTEEKNQLLATQNERLEAQVEARTAELKASQTQLIQKEKLANLGELTAGIAHEIQNPLNFVNNFSEVSTELIDELKQEAQAGNTDEVMAIADDLTSNLQKIHHHGNRASSIVKGMLEHSRTESGEKRPTNLNALADEYLKIAYYGLKTKDKVGFNCELITEFYPALEPVEVAPQEIGRVLLNLYNNAFYAVSQRAKQNHNADYKPTVWVSTSQVSGQEIIRVRDNGMGIPASVKAKIFQPFFTTKPTGEGTGLGLSLSYDIITKGHGGSLLVESQEGQGTEFRIEVPMVIG